MGRGGGGGGSNKPDILVASDVVNRSASPVVSAKPTRPSWSLPRQVRAKESFTNKSVCGMHV